MISLILKRVKFNTINSYCPIITPSRNFFNIGRGATGARTRKNFKPYPPQSSNKEIKYNNGKIVRFDEYQNLEKEKFEALQYRKYENNYSTKIKSNNKSLYGITAKHLSYFSHEGIRGPIIRDEERSQNHVDFSKSSLKFDYFENGVKVYRRFLGKNELILDTTDKEFINSRLKKIDTANDNRVLAYLMLANGKNCGSLYIRESCEGNEELEDSSHICIDPRSFNFFLNEEGTRLFYTIMDNKLRPYKLMCYDLKTQKKHTILEEINDQSFLDINISRDKKFIFINSNRLTQSKIHTIKTDFDYARDSPILLQPFQDGLECFVDHFNDTFFILSNETQNFKLYTVKDTVINSDENGEGNLLKFKKELKLINDSELIMDVELYKNFIVLFSKADYKSKIYYYNLTTKALNQIKLPNALSSISPTNNPDFDSSELTFNYSTPLTPRCELKFDLEKGNYINFGLPFISGIHHNDYVINRKFTNSGVPITLVHKNNLATEEGGHPCLLINYGAYGVNLELDYRPEWMALLNKGFILAFAHIRGGGELGPKWYSEGRALNRDNAINDLTEVAEFLKSSRLTSFDKLIGFTWSAGAVILGAVVNRRPDVFKGVVFRVPFLDPVTSLMDEKQALTQVEKEEWGDISKDPKALTHLLRYAPYDNLPAIIRKTDKFPNTLLITADKDEIVPYWHPLKYIAKLRTVLAREHSSAHFLITVADKGHADYLSDPKTREIVLTNELIFILKCIDKEGKLNYT